MRCQESVYCEEIYNYGSSFGQRVSCKLYRIISKENYLYVKGVLPYVKVTFVLLIRKIYILINL